MSFEGNYHDALKRIVQLESDLEGVRLINKLQAEALADERANNRAWLKANAPGGRIDDLRKVTSNDGGTEHG